MGANRQAGRHRYSARGESMYQHAANPLSDTYFCGTKPSCSPCWVQDMKPTAGWCDGHLICLQHAWAARNVTLCPLLHDSHMCNALFFLWRAASFNFLQRARRICGSFPSLRRRCRMKKRQRRRIIFTFEKAELCCEAQTRYKHLLGSV